MDEVKNAPAAAGPRGAAPPPVAATVHEVHGVGYLKLNQSNRASLTQCAVAIPALEWRLRVEASGTSRFDTTMDLGHTIRPHGQSPLPEPFPTNFGRTNGLAQPK